MASYITEAAVETANSEKIRVAVVFGTRPEAIKLYPVILELRQMDIVPIIISTGQQRELLRMTLLSLNLLPDLDLDLMRDDPTPTSFLEDCISRLSVFLNQSEPDFLLVQGDTFSATAGALAAYLNQVPVGHVEAGLRSQNLDSPWPEEGLRRVIDGISRILWAPTKRDLVPIHNDQKIRVVGNTIADSLRIIIGNRHRLINSDGPVIVTLHRRESFGLDMISALKSITRLSQLIENEIIFLQHPNPNVASAVEASGIRKSRVKIIEPLPYVEFINLISEASLLVTDSGGLQEESSILKLPTVVLRDTTERADALKEGRSVLSAPNGKDLIADALKLLHGVDPEIEDFSTPFGNGFSSTHIVEDIITYLTGSHNGNS